MAETLKKWPGKRRARYDPYPYGKWFDGQAWKLVRGEDYQCGTSTIVSLLYGAAKARGITIRTTAPKGGAYVVVQAFTPGKP